MIVTVISLFLVFFVFGNFLLKLLGITPEDNEIDNIFVYIGVGLGMFILLSVIFTLVHIPIYWPVYYIAVFILAFFIVFKFKPTFIKFKFDKGTIYSIIILIMFVVTAAILIQGSDKYPWLEDGDPWHHATVTKYIATQHTMFENANWPDLLKYLDPYPPSYNVIMAFVYQISYELIPTLKIVNAILVALTIPLSWVAFKHLFKDNDKALFATLVLFVVPCFLSHFIWAITICIVMFFPALYALTRVNDDKKWIIVAAISIGASLITQPSTQVVLFVMLGLYILSKMIVTRSIQKYLLLAYVLGIALSLLWWGAAFVRLGSPFGEHGWPGIWDKGQEAYAARDTGTALFKIKGSSDRAYTFNDFFYAPAQNMINNPLGLGPVLFFLFLMCLSSYEPRQTL